MLRYNNILRWTRTARFSHGVIAALLAFSLTLSATLPNIGTGVFSVSSSEASVSPRGAVAPVPVLNDRHHRQPAPSSRENPLIVPPGVIAVAPEVHGAVILTVRDDIPLDSRFVYTQTTSSRL